MQAEADRLLDDALNRTGARDPREPYRALLRELKERSASEYEAAVTEYRERVVRGIAEEGADPLMRWLEFGCGTVQRLNPGRTIVIDRTGRAAPYTPPPSWKDLILHLPDDRKSRAVLVGSPADLTAAQNATIELLVHGKLRVPLHESDDG
jgi:hypothetical protein